MNTKVEFPSALEVRVTRTFAAPIELVFAVLTEPEHLRHTLAPFDEQVTVCETDLRAGGDYRYVFVTPDGKECVFWGTFQEVTAPFRTVETWHFAGWQGVEAIEKQELEEAGELTKFTCHLTFKNPEDRAWMSKTDGLEAGYEKVAAYLQELLESRQR